MPGILEGIRVLDFGRYLAGPYCAAMLAEFGADVIRIEKRSGGEDRYLGPVAPDDAGTIFLQSNRNKRGMTLDPMQPGADEVMRRLITTADVVIANLPQQSLAAMKLDFESLKAIKPDIILTSVSAYGNGGPYSDRVGFDSVAQVMSGAVYMTSAGEGETPYRAQVPWVDYSTAQNCAFGTVLAIMARDKTGEPQLVEGALLATALTAANGLLIEQAVLSTNRTPSGNRGQMNSPNDIFRTRDGWIFVQAVGKPLFARWTKLMGEDHWLTDPRFANDRARGDHGAVISERMEKWCAERSNAEALATLAEAKIPASPVLKPQEVLNDPHVQAMPFFASLDYPGLPKPAPLARVPITMSGSPSTIHHRAPLLGEHTDAILGELGFGAEEIAGLRERRIV